MRPSSLAPIHRTGLLNEHTANSRESPYCARDEIHRGQHAAVTTWLCVAGLRSRQELKGFALLRAVSMSLSVARQTSVRSILRPRIDASWYGAGLPDSGGSNPPLRRLTTLVRGGSVSILVEKRGDLQLEVSAGTTPARGGTAGCRRAIASRLLSALR
jgi:hypothetical protein